MPDLAADELRVLGVLIEKSMTTPEQYPLSLNGIVSGANQKNNREPVMEMDEDRAFAAVSGLRGKGLAVQFDQPGMRVHKYRHAADAKMGLNPRQLAILAELMLRGAQTLGELRGRASRMHNIESVEVAKSVLGELMGRQEPLVRELPPAPGSRAERYQQLLGPEAEREQAAPAQAPAGGPAAEVQGGLAQRVESLEREVERLRQAVRKLAAGLGEADVLGDDGGGEGAESR